MTASGQKRRFECASAASAIAPIATESLHCGSTRWDRRSRGSWRKEARSGDDTANPAAVVPVITEQ